MTQASINIDNPCMAPVPTLLDTEPGDGTIKLTWSNEHSGDPNVIGYRVYYDQAGKSQLVAQVGLTTTYTDTDLMVGQRHFYKVTSLYVDCESDFSNVLSVVSAPLVSIGGLRGLSDGSWVFINDAVVTAGGSLNWGFMFASPPERHSGIKLLYNENLDLGQRIKLTGMVSRIDGEWQLSDISVLGKVFGDPLEPIGLNNKTIGSDLTQTLNYRGINTTGMLVRTWGKVTSVIPTGRVIYIDDGFGYRDGLGSHVGIRVQLPEGMSIPDAGQMVSVAGIARVEKHILGDWGFVNGWWYTPGTATYVPVIWVRDADDVRVIN